MKQLAGWADAYYLQMAPHNVCGPVGTAANVHFAVATPNFKILEHFNDFSDPWVDWSIMPPRSTPTDASDPRSPGPWASRSTTTRVSAHSTNGGRIRPFEEGWQRREEHRTLTLPLEPETEVP